MGGKKNQLIQAVLCQARSAVLGKLFPNALPDVPDVPGVVGPRGGGDCRGCTPLSGQDGAVLVRAKQ